MTSRNILVAIQIRQIVNPKIFVQERLDVLFNRAICFIYFPLLVLRKKLLDSVNVIVLVCVCIHLQM